MATSLITEYGKKPRIYVPDDLPLHATIALSESQAHYFKNVLRRNEGDEIRIFNGRDGEVLAALETIKKKSAAAKIIKQIHAQPPQEPAIHLLFAPIKKTRLDLLIEKSVELGVTDLHAITTDFTQNHHIKPERITAQICEAAEQCERMTIPRFHTPQPLPLAIKNWNQATPLYWANERGNDHPISQIDITQSCAFLIGPEGGFSENEITQLSTNDIITAISLGTRILRAETAAFMCLSHAAIQRMHN